MKNLLILTGLLIAIYSYSQAPQSFKYQATARDNSGNLITNQQVGMQISIIQGSANGNAVYSETFTPTTDEFGLININIGTGESNDEFSSINWSNSPYFIKIEMDVTGGNDYQDFGTSQLLSVPYALYANNAASANYSFNPSYPSGHQNLTPITFSITSGSYTVPTGKLLYILNVSSYSYELFINGIEILDGYYNQSPSSGAAQRLSQPLILDEGDVLSTDYDNTVSFNGYLIDK